MHILVMQHTDDIPLVDPPGLHGPFDSVREAQVYARDFREAHGIPGHENVEPTAAENEAWTEEGWYFAIVSPLKQTVEQMNAEAGK